MKEVNIEGLNKNDAITALIKSGLDFKAANKFWVENRPERGTGFKARFYAELEKGAMVEADFEKFIESESENIRRHKSAHNLVRELANRLWDLK